MATKHRCCVVYGALPPETRTQQAKLFNEQDNGYDVLVASDAIGMGLNLNIRRVVFFSLDKFDGDSKKPVPPAQVMFFTCGSDATLIHHWTFMMAILHRFILIRGLT